MMTAIRWALVALCLLVGREALGWSLFAFNLGVEFGQLLIVGVVAAVLLLVRRQSSVAAHRVAMAGSVAVVLAGLYWFVERVFLTGGA